MLKNKRQKHQQQTETTIIQSKHRSSNHHPPNQLSMSPFPSTVRLSECTLQGRCTACHKIPDRPGLTMLVMAEVGRPPALSISKMPPVIFVLAGSPKMTSRRDYGILHNPKRHFYVVIRILSRSTAITTRFQQAH